MKFTTAILGAMLALGVAHAQPEGKAMSPAIESGATVQLEYTLKDEAGKLLDSNKGQSPLTYTQGRQEIIPGLEKELNGLRASDEKQNAIAPEDGYARWTRRPRPRCRRTCSRPDPSPSETS